MRKYSHQLSAAELIQKYTLGQLTAQELKINLKELFKGILTVQDSDDLGFCHDCSEEIDELNDDGTLKTDRFSSVLQGSNSYLEFFTDCDFDDEEDSQQDEQDLEAVDLIKHSIRRNNR